MLQHVEIRMLGPFLVRRDDGRSIADSQWRSQKTQDLLRLLALSPGSPVDTETLLGELWPEAAPERARASLRTASYQLRKVLGENHVERRGSALVLTDVWVDADVFATRAAAVAAAHRGGRHQEVVRIARETEGLYVGDLEASDASPRLAQASAELRTLRRTVLVQGAEAALALGWVHDAHELARDASALDPHVERAARALMGALAGLGEIGEALAVFEGLRHDLGNDLGVDPAPQTRALHLQVLTGMSSVPEPDPAVPGPEDEVVAALRCPVERGAGLVLLEAEAGSGRSLLAARAARHRGLRLWHATSDGEVLDPEEDATQSCPRLLLIPEVPDLTDGELEHLLTVARARAAVLVVPVRRVRPEARIRMEVDLPVRTVTVRPLGQQQLADLAGRVLQGPTSARLVADLMTHSGGLAGRAVEVLRSWLAEGAVVWTPEGLTHRPARSGPRSRLTRIFQRRLRSMPATTIDTLCVAAVVRDGVTAHDVDVVLRRADVDPERPAQDALDSLVDVGLLEITSRGYVLANEEHREDLRAWLRPTAAMRLHQAVAEELDVDALARARHLVAAGRHQQAADLSAAGLVCARRRGAHEEEQEWAGLLAALPLPARHSGAPAPDRRDTRRARRLAGPVPVLAGLPVVQRALSGSWEVAVLEHVAMIA